jgi:hypothetical protein
MSGCRERCLVSIGHISEVGTAVYPSLLVVPTFDNQIRPQDTGHADPNASLCSSICRAKTCKDNGRDTTQSTEKRLKLCESEIKYDCVSTALS